MNKTALYTEQPNVVAKLIILHPCGSVEDFMLDKACVIGRKAEDSSADIHLKSVIASRRHGEIAVLDGEYYYRDTKSLNGTFVNDVLYGKTANAAVVKLENGDVLRIDQEDPSGRHPQATVMIFTLSYPDTAVWEHLEPGNEAAEINIGRAVGRDGLSLNNQMVSRNHASFYRYGGGWAVYDRNSTNGVYVNNRKIASTAALKPMDVVKIVDTYFIFDGSRFLYLKETSRKGGGASLIIQIAERCVWQRFKKMTLLQNINLTINSGEMVLILGGSGAGKTTFMNAVMGYEKADGQIFHGETDIYSDYDQMKYEIGFVPQQDLLRGSDTVFDTLRNSADMKMLTDTPPEQKTKRIEAVLELFGLQRERDSLVSKLSGGQRKRLSIAVEYIADPGLFFLDEPDSGLDGIMAMSLNENLRTIADEGKIVMVITHSPDRVAHLYDKVIVLAKSTADNCGHLAFYGSIDEAKDFFEAVNLEGIVKRINRPDEGGDGKSDFYIKKYEQYIG
jgi:ABC-type multidrug transport system ATPase subunit